MGNEIWKPIIMEEYDFSKFYLISNYGRVCSLRTHNGVTNRILKPSIDTCSYQFVTLYFCWFAMSSMHIKMADVSIVILHNSPVTTDRIMLR